MKRTVKDVMTRDVIVAKTSWSFKDVARCLDTAGISALPVVDDAGMLVGIVSEADLLLKEEGHAAGEHHVKVRGRRVERRKAQAQNAADLMTSPAVSIGPDASLPATARLMHGRGVKRLPVLDPAGKVIGIVSRADLVRIFLRSDGDIRDEVVHDVIEKLLWIDPALVKVDVTDGSVALEGRLDKKTLVDLLIELVEKVDGVVGVVSRLSYETNDTRLRPDVRLPWDLVPAAWRYPAGRRSG